MLRWITAGESHGPALVGVLEGMVAGVSVTTKELQAELARRKLGYGRSPRMAFEADELEVLGGLRHGVTQGGPVAVRIGNTEWPKWETVMAADPVDPELIAHRARNAPLTRPRPGHADLAGMTKYGFDEARPVLERASARETAARVVLGTVAKAFLQQALGVTIVSHVVGIGAVDAPDDEPLPGPPTSTGSTPTRCARSPTPRVPRWPPRSTPPTTRVTPSVGSSRSSPTGCRSASAPTCRPTAASTPGSPPR